MRRKTLSLLAPIAAIMAFAVVPAMASAAEDVIQGTEFTASSGNLITETEETGTLECEESILQFQKISASQAQVIGGAFRNSPVEPHCSTSIPGVTVVVQTNAASMGWFFQTGEQGPGTLQAGLGPIQFSTHFWDETQTTELGQCVFTQNGAITVEYEQEVTNPNLLNVEANFTSENCGTGHLTGNFTTNNGLFIH